jgi:transcriptional regulator with XRE-family HTH domain
MSFRSWRERMLLSQERVAEMSGLSLRTVQRLEAGHRVSYASLRALAVAFKTDVDLLEREYYAVNQPTDEFVEIPRWIRLLNDRLWFGGPRLSRRDLLVIEALNIGFAAIGFAVSFLAPLGAKAAIVRTGAVVSLLCSYLVAVSIRMSDKYKLWPGSRNASPEMPRTWRSVTAEYALFIVIGILGIVMAAWLFVGF